MGRGGQRGGAWLIGCVLLLACGSPAPTGGTASSQRANTSATTASAPKRIVAAIQGNPLGGYQKLDPNNSQRGNQELGAILHAGLTVTESTGQLRPQMAEAVPTVENGLWTIQPDGQMETRWKIRTGAKWHDGVALTSDDLLFTFQVVRDREIPIFRDPSFTYLDSAEILDPQTVSVRWKMPFIQADRMFSDRVATPLPKHVLETAYTDDKASFTQSPFWSNEFVGLGPYKVKDWERGSFILVQANDAYVLGRPKIDEIELRTITDTNAIMANLLAGSVDLTIGRSLSLDQIVQLRERMPEALLQTPLTSLLVLNPQFINGDPAVITDLTFRRALLHAIDRQELAETIDYGLVPIAEQFIYPSTPEARATESSIVRYDFDPRKSVQMIESLGYVRGADGFFRDVGGQQLRLEIRATAGEANPKTMYAAAAALEKVGVAIEPVIIPIQFNDDQRYRATFPGFIVNGGPADTGLDDFHSAQARLPENGYSGRNRSRYQNPQLDGFIDRYLTTIPFETRMEFARQITRHVTENLPALPLFFDTWPSATSARLLNVGVSANLGMSTWNVHTWELKS